MDNPLVFPIVLQVIGLIIIMAEVILPSGGLLTLLATGVLGYSLYAVFSNVSPSAGFGFVIADLILLPIIVIVGFKFLAKSPVTLRKNLSSENGVSVQKNALKQYIGQQGKTITDLRPSGIALIGSERFDVVTEGKYLDKETPIVVVAVTGNRIVVKEH
jgi:membrane-bound serine protease (ClpP class)